MTKILDSVAFESWLYNDFIFIYVSLRIINSIWCIYNTIFKMVNEINHFRLYPSIWEYSYGKFLSNCNIEVYRKIFHKIWRITEKHNRDRKRGTISNLFSFPSCERIVSSKLMIVSNKLEICIYLQRIYVAL